MHPRVFLGALLHLPDHTPGKLDDVGAVAGEEALAFDVVGELEVGGFDAVEV